MQLKGAKGLVDLKIINKQFFFFMNRLVADLSGDRAYAYILSLFLFNSCRYYTIIFWSFIKK